MHYLRPAQNWTLSWLAGGPPAGGSLSRHRQQLLQPGGGEHHHGPYLTGSHRNLQVTAGRAVSGRVCQPADLPRHLRAQLGAEGRPAGRLLPQQPLLHSQEGEVGALPPRHRPGLPKPAQRGLGDAGQHPGRHRLCRPGFQRCGEPGRGQREPRPGPSPSRLPPAEERPGQSARAGVAAVQAGTPGRGGRPTTLRVSQLRLQRMRNCYGDRSHTAPPKL